MIKPQPAKFPPCAHFVTTIVGHNGIGTKFLKHYIVIAPTTSRAISLVELGEFEEILEAKEMSNYQLIMDITDGAK